MSETSYKEQKLLEIGAFRNQVYLNYIDQVRTVNGYIVALSSAAVLAMFTLFYRFNFTANSETLLHLDILTWIKISTFLFVCSLILIIFINIVYTIDSSDLEKRYAVLYENIQKKTIDGDIEKEINNNYEVMQNEFDTKYSTYERMRYISYICFLSGVIVVGLLIVTYSGSGGTA